MASGNVTAIQENETALPVQGQPVLSSALAPPVSVEQKKRDFLSDFTKITVILGFFLYTIGFLIWRAYLFTFGISAVAFLRTEYLAAALCYLINLIVIGLPPALLAAKAIRHIKKQPESEVSNPLWVVLGFWAVATANLANQFPSWEFTAGVRVWLYVTAGISLAQLALLLAALKYKWERVSKELQKPHSFLLVWALQSVFLLAFRLDTGFFLWTVGWCALAGCYSLEGHKYFWQGLSFFYKAMVIAFFALTLVRNIQSFGKNVFGNIPQVIGGGKPERALLRFSPLKQELPWLLGIPEYTNTFGSNYIFGPVSILVRSEKELIFVLDEVEVRRTNVVSSFSTNINGSVSQTNIATNVVTLTNIDIAGKTPKARQLRTDSVDAVIYVSYPGSK
jgi:hypothetical protein